MWGNMQIEVLETWGESRRKSQNVVSKVDIEMRVEIWRCQVLFDVNDLEILDKSAEWGMLLRNIEVIDLLSVSWGSLVPLSLSWSNRAEVREVGEVANGSRKCTNSQSCNGVEIGATWESRNCSKKLMSLEVALDVKVASKRWLCVICAILCDFERYLRQRVSPFWFYNRVNTWTSQ